MQTRFAYLHFGAVLKALFPSQLRLWRRRTSLAATSSSFPLQPGWCWADGAHKVQRRVSSRYFDSDHKIAPEDAKSPFFFLFLSFSNYVIVGGKWSFISPSALPSWISFHLLFWWPGCNPGLISSLSSPHLAPVFENTSSDLNHSWRQWFCLQRRFWLRLLHSLYQNVI